MEQHHILQSNKAVPLIPIWFVSHEKIYVLIHFLLNHFMTLCEYIIMLFKFPCISGCVWDSSYDASSGVQFSQCSDWEMCQWLDAACQACSCLRPAWSSQPQPSTYSWDPPQTAITASLCLPSTHHPSPCPSSLVTGVWTSGLGKWQEEFTKLTRHMSFGSVFYPYIWA